MDQKFTKRFCSFNTSTDTDWLKMIDFFHDDSKRQCDRSAMGRKVINHLRQKQNVSVWMLQECGSVLQHDQWFRDIYDRTEQVRSSRDHDCDVAIIWMKDQFSMIDFPIISNPNSDGYRCISVTLEHCESKQRILFSSMIFNEYKFDAFDYDSSMNLVKKADNAKLHLEFLHSQFPMYPHVVGCDLNGDRILNDVVPKILCQASNRSMLECCPQSIATSLDLGVKKIHTRLRYNGTVASLSNDDTILIKKHPHLIVNTQFVYRCPFKLGDSTYPSDHLPLVQEFMILIEQSSNHIKGCPIDMQSFCPLC